MKRNILLWSILCMAVVCFYPYTGQSASKPTVINEANFPDKHFRRYVKKFDKNKDNKLSAKEKKAVVKIQVGNRNDSYSRKIQNLQGLEYFSKLKTLKVYCPKLKKIDIGKNTKLEILHLSLDGDKNLSNRNLKNIDLSKNKNLKELEIWDAYFDKLDLSYNTRLQYISICCENLRSLNVGKNRRLKKLICEYGKIKRLDVSGCPNLRFLFLSSNQIEQIYFGKIKKIEDLSLYGNRIKKINVEQFQDLKHLNCNHTDITHLDVTKNKKLEELQCISTNIKRLDVTHNPELKVLWLNDTQIKKLDVSNCRKLESLVVIDTKLKSLDVSNITMEKFEFDLQSDLPDSAIKYPEWWK